MEYPKRKHPRLCEYNYSLPGFYYVTIHLQNHEDRLSRIISQQIGATVQLTPLGRLAEEQLFALQSRYTYVKLDHYVIMPTHIHAIFQFLPGEAQRPGLTDIVCAYKSLTTRVCNQEMQTPGRKLFQTSFYETVLRNEQAYRECWRYIAGNPSKWIAEGKR